MRYELVAKAFYGDYWAINRAAYDVLDEIVRMRMAGDRFPAAELEARVGAKRAKGIAVQGRVTVIPLRGIISHRMGIMSEHSGGMSTEEFGQYFDSAIRDESVGAIVIDTDSPGGPVAGVEELSAKIFDARGLKPILAVANSMMASSAYWIASAADEVIVTPSGEVGSIGIIASHTDVSEAMAAEGVKRTIITAGEFKGELEPSIPLSNPAHEYIQSRANEYYRSFVDSVARNRDRKAGEVRKEFGQARMVGAVAAKAAGMVDRIDTLEGTLARLGVDMGLPGAVAASDDYPAIETRKRRQRLRDRV